MSRAGISKTSRAVPHADDAVGVARGKLGLVKDAEHREIVLAGQTAQQPHDLLGGLGVEAGHRLVGEEDAGMLRQSASDRDALRLAARQRSRPLLGKLGEADLREAAHGRLDLVGRHTAERGPEIGMTPERARCDIGDDAAAPHEIGLLEDHREHGARPPQLLAGKLGEILVRDPGFAFARRQDPRNAAQHGRFAAAVAAEDDDKLAGSHRQADPGKGQLAVGIPHREIAELEQDRGPSSCRASTDRC